VAPETGQDFGKKARANFAGQVEGKAAVVVWSKKDGYGRLLGAVLLGSMNINLEQMKAGCAWYLKRYAAGVPEIERVQYEAAEGGARESKSGLWQQQQAIPLREWRRGRRKVTPARRYHLGSPSS
jgi:endonuclease YncB( thermonuclease family)